MFKENHPKLYYYIILSVLTIHLTILHRMRGSMSAHVAIAGTFSQTIHVKVKGLRGDYCHAE